MKLVDIPRPGSDVEVECSSSRNELKLWIEAYFKRQQLGDRLAMKVCHCAIGWK